MPWPFSPKEHSNRLLQNMSDDLWFKIIPFLEIRDLQRLALAYRHATQIFFKEDVDCYRYFLIQALIAEIEQQFSLKIQSLNNKILSTAIRNTSIKNWFCRLGPFIPGATILPPLAVNYVQQASIRSDFIERVLLPTCTIQWSHFSRWYHKDNSCVSLFNCTASLCSTAEYYESVAAGYIVLLIIGGVVFGSLAIMGGASLILERCKPYSLGPIVAVHQVTLIKTYLLENVVSIDFQRRIAAVLNDELDTVASSFIEKNLNDLKRVASSINPDMLTLQQRLTTRLENSRKSNPHQFFNADLVSIDVHPDCNDEKSAFLR